MIPQFEIRPFSNVVFFFFFFLISDTHNFLHPIFGKDGDEYGLKKRTVIISL